jgi:hypothetical protein
MEAAYTEARIYRSWRIYGSVHIQKRAYTDVVHIPKRTYTEVHMYGSVHIRKVHIRTMHIWKQAYTEASIYERCIYGSAHIRKVHIWKHAYTEAGRCIYEENRSLETHAAKESNANSKTVLLLTVQYFMMFPKEKTVEHSRFENKSYPGPPSMFYLFIYKQFFPYFLFTFFTYSFTNFKYVKLFFLRYR